MPISELFNPHRYNDPEWWALHTSLESYSTDKHVFKHTGGEYYRKGWEWTQCLFGLQQLSMIAPDKIGIGIGAGREPLIFWLADHVQHVTATDLYGNQRWSVANGAEAPADFINDFLRYCPRQVDGSKITVQNADGTNLPYPDSGFDFSWSLSSIEHFGSHENSARAVQEMVRVTKPGGIICIATELLLLPDQTAEERFNRGEFEKYVIHASPAADLVDGVSWALPPLEFLIDQITFNDAGVDRWRRHVVLNDGNVQWTSMMVFLRRNGRAI